MPALVKAIIKKREPYDNTAKDAGRGGGVWNAIAGAGAVILQVYAIFYLYAYYN